MTFTDMLTGCAYFANTMTGEDVLVVRNDDETWTISDIDGETPTIVDEEFIVLRGHYYENMRPRDIVQYNFA